MDFFVTRWLNRQEAMTSRVAYAVGIPSLLFWLTFVVFQLYWNASREISNLVNLVTIQLQQFVLDNDEAMKIYDFERIRVSASKLSFVAPTESLTVVGPHGVTIYKKNQNRTSENLITLPIGTGVVTLDQQLGVHYEFTHNFANRAFDETPTINGVLSLDGIVISAFGKMADASITILFFLLLQLGLILWLTRYAMSPLTRFANRLSDVNADATQLECAPSDPVEVVRFVAVYNHRLKSELLLRDEMSRSQADTKIGRVARQVAHDIRSPLSALQILDGDLDLLPEDRRHLVRSAVARIRDIANDLVSRHQNSQAPDSSATINLDSSTNLEASESILLHSLLDQIITEKRLQFRSQIDIDIDFDATEDAYGLFSVLQPNTFKRVVSNLVNNAVESLSGKGEVRVTLTGDSSSVNITIKDNGCGIPEDVMKRLGERGFTANKASGSGLGFHHAKQCISRWGGSINVLSRVGVGSDIKLTLQRTVAPSWFLDSLIVSENKRIAILDDDSSIHQIWRSRFESFVARGSAITLCHFSTSIQLQEWLDMENASYSDTTFLIDYELAGGPVTGLDVIEQLGINSSSVLVTSRYEERPIKERCLCLGVKMIPKPLAGILPIVMQHS